MTLTFTAYGRAITTRSWPTVQRLAARLAD